MAKSRESSVKEKLASLETDMAWLKAQISNHLSHHWAVTITLVSAMIGQLVILIIGAIKLIH